MEIQQCKVSPRFPLESRLSQSLNRFHSLDKIGEKTEKEKRGARVKTPKSIFVERSGVVPRVVVI